MFIHSVQVERSYPVSNVSLRAPWLAITISSLLSVVYSYLASSRCPTLNLSTSPTAGFSPLIRPNRPHAIRCVIETERKYEHFKTFSHSQIVHAAHFTVFTFLLAPFPSLKAYSVTFAISQAVGSFSIS